MKFEEKQIRVEYNNVSYIDEGPTDGVTIICIHGFPFNKGMWENQIDAWKEDYRVIAYDVRGHGKSTADTSQTSITRFANDLFLFMEALSIDKAILCGLSMGGYIALNAVLRQPAKIEALILCDTQCAADTAEGKKTNTTVSLVVVNQKLTPAELKRLAVQVHIGNSGDIPLGHRDGSLQLALAARNYATAPR